MSSWLASLSSALVRDPTASCLAKRYGKTRCSFPRHTSSVHNLYYAFVLVFSTVRVTSLYYKNIFSKSVKIQNSPDFGKRYSLRIFYLLPCARVYRHCRSFLTFRSCWLFDHSSFICIYTVYSAFSCHHTLATVSSRSRRFQHFIYLTFA